jgi:hypothetical protein
VAARQETTSRRPTAILVSIVLDLTILANVKVSGRSQPPLRVGLFAGEPAGSGPLHRWATMVSCTTSKLTQMQNPPENCGEAVQGHSPEQAVGNHEEPFGYSWTLNMQETSRPDKWKPKHIHGTTARLVEPAGLKPGIEPPQAAAE